MSYVDEDYYNSCSDIIKEKLSGKLEKATDQINSLTYNRIVGVGFDNLTPFQQDKVKKAICVHADFIEQYGSYIDMPLSGFTAGSTSISFNAQKINGVTTTQEVLNYLNSTGLSCRRI